MALDPDPGVVGNTQRQPRGRIGPLFPGNGRCLGRVEGHLLFLAGNEPDRLRLLPGPAAFLDDHRDLVFVPLVIGQTIRGEGSQATRQGGGIAVDQNSRVLGDLDQKHRPVG